MIIKKRKGQFFLVATLIIVTIIFSFSIVYNSASPAKSDSEKTSFLANDIKYEAVQTINSGVNNGLAETEISTKLKDLALLFSKSNPEYLISVVHGESLPLSAYQFKNGVSSPTTATATAGRITLTLNNTEYLFNITKGYNFYVIVQKEGNDERYIATA